MDEWVRELIDLKRKSYKSWTRNQPPRCVLCFCVRRGPGDGGNRNNDRGDWTCFLISFHLFSLWNVKFELIERKITAVLWDVVGGGVLLPQKLDHCFSKCCSQLMSKQRSHVEYTVAPKSIWTLKNAWMSVH